MNKNITTIINKPATLYNSYDVFDVLGNTFGRYFDYKKETALIKYETQKVKHKAKVLCKEIDAELQKSLDSNDKNFQKEMFRLKNISKDLKNDSKTKKEILKNISIYIEMLANPHIDMSVKESIPKLIEMSHEALAKEGKQSFLKLKAMSSFNSDTKSIKG